MPCEPLLDKNGKPCGFICSRGHTKAPHLRCYKCGKLATKLCDYRHYSVRHGKDEYGRARRSEIADINTCDKPMCDDCANHYDADTDFCDEHNNELARFDAKKAEQVYKQQLKMFGIGESEE